MPNGRNDRHQAVTIDFCGTCGEIPPAGAGNNPPVHCKACGSDITERGDRIQGLFSKEDADKLERIER